MLLELTTYNPPRNKGCHRNQATFSAGSPGDPRWRISPRIERRDGFTAIRLKRPRLELESRRYAVEPVPFLWAWKQIRGGSERKF